MHKRYKHEWITYTCDQCDVSFTGKGNLTKHSQSKQRNILSNCDECDFIVTKDSQIAMQKRCKHEKITYTCGQCNVSFTGKGNITKHSQSKHKGIQYLIVINVIVYSLNKVILQCTRDARMKKHIPVINVILVFRQM